MKIEAFLYKKRCCNHFNFLKYNDQAYALNLLPFAPFAYLCLKFFKDEQSKSWPGADELYQG